MATDIELLALLKQALSFHQKLFGDKSARLVAAARHSDAELLTGSK
jgi:hypothetical protein